MFKSSARALKFRPDGRFIVRAGCRSSNPREYQLVVI
jgi:hypothetical protein